MLYRVYFRIGPDAKWRHEPVRYEGHIAAIIATSIKLALRQVGYTKAEAVARIDDAPTVKGQEMMIVSPPEA